MTQVNGLDLRSWKYRSSADEGLHSVVASDNSICLGVWIFRLNIWTYGWRHDVWDHGDADSHLPSYQLYTP